MVEPEEDEEEIGDSESGDELSDQTRVAGLGRLVLVLDGNDAGKHGVWLKIGFMTGSNRYSP